MLPSSPLAGAPPPLAGGAGVWMPSDSWSLPAFPISRAGAQEIVPDTGRKLVTPKRRNEGTSDNIHRSVLL